MEYELATLKPSPQDVEGDSDSTPLVGSKKKILMKHKLPSGWKFSLSLGASTALIVLMLNLSFTIWSATKHSYNNTDEDVDHDGEPDTDPYGGLRVLGNGTCDNISTVNSGLHLFINIISSILLAASNYCMQCLSAPTRGDIYRLHSENRWLDIGVPSVHNISEIPGRRGFLWLLLILSSVPLHLLYNSVIFTSISTVSYQIYTMEYASNDAASIFNVSLDKFAISDQYQEYNKSLKGSAYPGYIEGLWNLGAAGDLELLDASKCLDAYATAFQTKRGDVLLVLEPSSDEAIHGIPRRREISTFDADTEPGCLPDVYEWMCNPTSGRDSDSRSYNCTIDPPCRNLIADKALTAGNWRPFNDSAKVKYCLSKAEIPSCHLYFSTTIMSLVVVANAVKVLIMIYTAFRPPKGIILVLGDAIESFLSSPDEFTTKSCLLSADDVKRSRGGAWKGPRIWSPVRRHWAAAVTRRRWVVSAAMYLILLGLSIFFLAWGIVAIDGSHDIQSLWKLGFGKTVETTLIAFPDVITSSRNMLMWSVLTANLPQLLFSFLYFQYNALFTGMHVAKEWSDLGLKHRGIRVSADPKGRQRSRYFLQLPYRWGIPLIGFSILIHWLLSRSLFLVTIDVAEFAGGVDDSVIKFSTCGYSPAAIFFVIFSSLIMVPAVILTGYRRLSTCLPVAGSCSIAIAAACHHPDGIAQPETPFSPLRWGVTRKPGQAGDDTPGHCGFSDDLIDFLEDPEAGEEYA